MGRFLESKRLICFSLFFSTFMMTSWTKKKTKLVYVKCLKKGKIKNKVVITDFRLVLLLLNLFL